MNRCVLTMTPLLLRGDTLGCIAQLIHERLIAFVERASELACNQGGRVSHTLAARLQWPPFRALFRIGTESRVDRLSTYLVG